MSPSSHSHYLIVVLCFCVSVFGIHSSWLINPSIGAHRIALTRSTKNLRNATQKETCQRTPDRRTIPGGRRLRPQHHQDHHLTTHMPQTSHPHTSTEFHATGVDTREPEGPDGAAVALDRSFCHQHCYCRSHTFIISTTTIEQSRSTTGSNSQ
jgi:hypothetical protein